jgi:dTDP-D-glucose 4,6-dehydratase
MIKDTEQYSNWITYVADRPFNDQRYYISNQKIKDLGWKIEKNFLTGLSELVTTECGEQHERKSSANSNKIVSYSELHADHKKYEAEWESNLHSSHN